MTAKTEETKKKNPSETPPETPPEAPPETPPVETEGTGAPSQPTLTTIVHKQTGTITATFR